MMGTKIRSFTPLPRDISLEELVPKGHFYRRLQARLDLSFVRELVEPLYAQGGRPSVDPVVFFKLQLVMFFEDLRSERQLMRVIADRLSVRWYLGYDLHETLPDLPPSPASGNASASRSSAASSRGSSRSASVPGWCGARSCTSTLPRSRPTPRSTRRGRARWWRAVWRSTWRKCSPRTPCPPRRTKTAPGSSPGSWGPMAKKGKRLRKRTRLGTAGSPRPDARSGGWSGGATSGWRIKG
jgi:hypothetical protein